MRLRDIAHARTGDKGDTSNISVIAYRARDWPLIERTMTAERVARHFGIERADAVSRYALPQLHALNFVLRGFLTGGVTRSLAIDAHGKCLGATLLDIEMEAGGESLPRP
ncbi:hypothetical protein [Jannaschia sp. LMIT008]|uniref:AtuA-related protein n=1 Tax=Jannaschia maritima TaxID=3032585 RepID=UPI0028112962|nr:hypothetical protein [Jannaschia sp. LMIT008]